MSSRQGFNSGPFLFALLALLKFLSWRLEVYSQRWLLLLNAICPNLLSTYYINNGFGNGPSLCGLHLNNLSSLYLHELSRGWTNLVASPNSFATSSDILTGFDIAVTGSCTHLINALIFSLVIFIGSPKAPFRVYMQKSKVLW